MALSLVSSAPFAFWFNAFNATSREFMIFGLINKYLRAGGLVGRANAHRVYLARFSGTDL